MTFRKLTAVEIVALVRQAGLVSVEWGGDVHVPHGDLAAAREVRELTEAAGLRVAAYGSYYRVGGGAQGPDFDQVLETAVELGAPTIRVWPGAAGSAATDEAGRWRVVEDLRRIGELAARKLVSISIEFHDGTLTDTNESASQLMVEADHSNVFTCWQPHNGEETDECLRGLRAVAPRVSNIHVFHWWPTSKERHPLADGAPRWRAFFDEIDRLPGDRHALLEFVQDDLPANLLRDAATLKRWLAGQW